MRLETTGHHGIVVIPQRDWHREHQVCARMWRRDCQASRAFRKNEAYEKLIYQECARIGAYWPHWQDVQKLAHLVDATWPGLLEMQAVTGNPLGVFAIRLLPLAEGAPLFYPYPKAAIVAEQDPWGPGACVFYAQPDEIACSRPGYDPIDRRKINYRFVPDPGLPLRSPPCDGHAVHAALDVCDGLRWDERYASPDAHSR